MAQYLGVEHAVAVNSGTDALLIALEAMGIGPGDEVITTPFTFYATVEAIALAGGNPVFVDIEPNGFNLDPTRIEGAMTERTRAIVPVHIFGEPAPMNDVMRIARERNVMVLEDCAQSFGASMAIGDDGSVPGRAAPRFKAGSIGDAAAFSFYPTKNLGAYGDGGLVATCDAEVAERARALRNHAARPGHRYEHEAVGHNSRLDAMQAAILRVKLPRIESWNALRREVAGRYDGMFSKIDGVVVPRRTPGHVYLQYTIRIPSEVRDAVLGELRDDGIAGSVFYPPAEAAWPAFVGRNTASCKHAMARANEVVSLPMHPRLSPEDQERIAEVVRSALA